VSSSEPVTGADAAETALLDKLQAGDETAYATLVQCYGGVMLNTVRRIVKHEEDAHDCLQDAFLQAFRKLHLFERRSSLKTWLHRLAVNSALMKVRARNRKDELVLEDWMSEFGEDGHRLEPQWDFSEPVESLLMRHATRTLVQQSIDALPDQYRIVLLLRDIEGYATDEVATLLETSTGSVKTRLHRARAALKKKLEPLFAGDNR
jgi:RNA polymerase sigma-70 factor (ECF subfamily)